MTDDDLPQRLRVRAACRGVLTETTASVMEAAAAEIERMRALLSAPAAPAPDLSTLAAQFDAGGAESVLRTYLALHRGKIGAHWLWAAIERVVAGEPIGAVMDDYGWSQPRKPLALDKDEIIKRARELGMDLS